MCLRNRFSLPALIILTAGVVACSSGDGDQDVVHRVGEDGVREVISTAPAPLPPPWDLELDLVIGVGYGDEEEMLRQPLDFTMLEDGTYVILDSSPLQIRIFDHDGQFVREFAQPGEGPADIRDYDPLRAHGVMPLGGPGEFELWTGWPLYRQRWTLQGKMTTSSTMVSTHPLLSGIGARISWPHGEDLLAHVIHTNDTQEEGYFNRDFLFLGTDWAGTRLDTLLVIHHPRMPEMGGLMGPLVGEFSPRDSILPASNGLLYVARWEDDWIREIDPDTGRMLKRFRWEHESDTFEGTRLDMEKFRLGERYAEIASEVFAWYRERLSITFLAEGPDNEIWVQRTLHDTGLGNPSALIYPVEGIWPTDVFSSEGEYLGRMDLPFAPRHQKTLGGDVHAVMAGEEGAPTLVRYRAQRRQP